MTKSLSISLWHCPHSGSQWDKQPDFVWLWVSVTVELYNNNYSESLWDVLIKLIFFDQFEITSLKLPISCFEYRLGLALYEGDTWIVYNKRVLCLFEMFSSHWKMLTKFWKIVYNFFVELLSVRSEVTVTQMKMLRLILGKTPFEGKDVIPHNWPHTPVRGHFTHCTAKFVGLVSLRPVWRVGRKYTKCLINQYKGFVLILIK